MKKGYSYFLILLLTFSVLSCKKIRENRLVGSWEYVSLASWEEGIDETWTFTEDEELIITKTINEESTTTIDTASYFLKSEGLSGYIEIYELDNYTDGKYRIKKLTGKQLKIIRLFDGYGNSEYVLREFIKN